MKTKIRSKITANKNPLPNFTLFQHVIYTDRIALLHLEKI